MNELADCPFCGGSPEIVRPRPAGIRFIKCLSCGAATREVETDGAAKEIWNRRHDTSDVIIQAASIFAQTFDAWLSGESLDEITQVNDSLVDLLAKLQRG